MKKAFNKLGGKTMSKSGNLIIISIIFLLVFGLAGCNNAPVKKETATGGALNIAIAAAPPTLDPELTTDNTQAAIGNQIYEGLVAVNSKGEPVPMLASKVDTSDNQTYTFTLRQGVKFHNGKEMTDDDVVASLNRWQKVFSNIMPDLKGASFEAKDKYTVVMKLQQPSIWALYGLAIWGQGPVIMPKEIVDSATSAGVSEYIGTGPYKFVKWVPNQYVELAKNPDYKSVDAPSDGNAGKKDVSVDNVFFRFVPDVSTQIAGLQTGQYDVVYDVPGDSLQQVKSFSNVKIGTQFGYTLNLLINKNTFANVKMRQALNYALDKNAIMLAGMGDKELYELDSSYLSKQTGAWYSDAGKEIYGQYDINKAKELLAQSGYSGKEITLLTYNDDPICYNAAVAIKQQLEQAGFKVKLDAYDTATYMSRRADPKNWDIFITSASTYLIPQRSTLLNPSWIGGPKKGTDDDAIITAMQGLTNAKSVAEAQKLWPNVQQLSWQVLPYIKLGDFPVIWAYSDKIQGFQRTGTYGIALWNTKIVK